MWKITDYISSVIRRKGDCQNGCYKKKHVEFLEKRTFLTTWYEHMGKNVRFLENLTCFVFLQHPFWDSPICLVADDLYKKIKQFCLRSKTMFARK